MSCVGFSAAAMAEEGRREASRYLEHAGAHAGEGDVDEEEVGGRHGRANHVLCRGHVLDAAVLQLRT